MHKFLSVVAACLVKVRALFLSEPAVWQIPTSSVYICAQPASSYSDFSLILPPPYFHFLASGFHSALLAASLSFIHLPYFILLPAFKFSIFSLCAILPSFLVSLNWKSLCVFLLILLFFFGSVTPFSVSSLLLFFLKPLFDLCPTSTHCLAPLLVDRVCDFLSVSSSVTFSLYVTILIFAASGQKTGEKVKVYL